MNAKIKQGIASPSATPAAVIHGPLACKLLGTVEAATAEEALRLGEKEFRVSS